MKLTELLPEIPEAEQTPRVKQWVAVIEQLGERVEQLEELTAQERVPAGSRCLGYDDDVIQDLRIELHNTRFRRARWRTPEGDSLKGDRPEEAQDLHFSPHLRSDILYPHDPQHVTPPLLREQRHAFGVDISSGQLARLLTAGHEGVHAETEAVLRTGLEVSSTLNVDDTSARHQGKNGYGLYLGSQFFAWYRSSLTQDRLSFITVLWNASPCPSYGVDAVAVESLRPRGASPWLIDRFTDPSVTSLPDDAAWEAYGKARAIVGAEEVRRATEAARLASPVAQGWLAETVILSDGAGQFAMLQHALCWIHAERALRRRVPPGPLQHQAQERVLDEVWEHYRALKTYQQSPRADQAVALSAQFDALCLQSTG